jgi:hypothetical protein
VTEPVLGVVDTTAAGDGAAEGEAEGFGVAVTNTVEPPPELPPPEFPPLEPPPVLCLANLALMETLLLGIVNV